MNRPLLLRQLPAAFAVLACATFLCWAATVDAGRTTLAGEATLGTSALLDLDAAPPVTMTPTPFRLTLRRAGDGGLLAGARVRCDLAMPAMPMPENRPEIREESPGIYSGEAVFTMAGAWRATCEVIHPDGRRETLVFDLERVLLQ